MCSADFGSGCAKWSPTDASCICSQHFKADDFENLFITIPGMAFVSRTVLKKDAVPSTHSQKLAEPSIVDNDISSADLWGFFNQTAS